MSKIRINELARQLEVKSREVIDKLHELGIAEKVTHSSSIDEDMAEQLRRYYRGEPLTPPHPGAPHKGAGTAAVDSRADSRADSRSESRAESTPAAEPPARRFPAENASSPV